MRPASREERPIADSDIAGNYRFGVQPEEVADLHPKVRALLALENGRSAEIAAFRKRQQVKRFGYERFHVLFVCSVCKSSYEIQYNNNNLMIQIIFC